MRACSASRSATTAWRAAAAASAAGTFSNPLSRSPARSSSGNGSRHRAPRRTTSTPEARRARPTCEPRRPGRTSRRAAASRPAEAQASTKSGTSPSRAASSATGCDRAHLVVGRLAGDDGRVGELGEVVVEVVDADPAEAVDRDDPGRRSGPLRGAAARRSARPPCGRWPSRGCALGTAVQAQQPAVDGVGARRRERHLVRRARRGPRRWRPARCRARAGLPGPRGGGAAGRRTPCRAAAANASGRPGAAPRRRRRRGTPGALPDGSPPGPTLGARHAANLGHAS